MDFLPRLRLEIGLDESDITRPPRLLARSFVMTGKPVNDDLMVVTLERHSGTAPTDEAGGVFKGSRQLDRKTFEDLMRSLTTQYMRVPDPLALGTMPNSYLEQLARRHDPGTRNPDSIQALRIVHAVQLQVGVTNGW